MPDEKTVEEWTYMGRRFNGAHVHHLWRDQSGVERFYGAGGKAAIIGGVYRIPVDRGGDHVTASFGLLEFDRVTVGNYDGELNEWMAMDLGVMARRSQENAEKRYAKDSKDIGDITLRDMRDIMSKQPAHIRRGTLAAVIDYLRG